MSTNSYPLNPDILVSDIFFRTLAGLFGGIFGTIVLLIGVFLSSSLSETPLVAETLAEGVSPLFTFILIVMIYLAVLVSTLASLSFFHYTNRERYPFILSTLSHTFSLITLIFLAATPLTLLLSLSNFELIGTIGVIQLGMAGVLAIIIQESVNNSKHILLALYSATLALFFFLFMSLALYFALQTTSFLILLAFPICWASMGFWQVSLEMAYQWFYGIYGSDFLNSETRLGSDYVKAAKK